MRLLFYCTISFALVLHACAGPGADPRKLADTVNWQKRDTVNPRSLDTLHPRPGDSSQALAGDFAAVSSRHFDSMALKRFFVRYPAYRSMEKDIRAFYRQRSYSFAWFDRQGLTEQASNLYNRVRQLPEENPSADLPYRGEMDSSMDNLTPPAHRYLLNTELLLTSAYFYFAYKAWKGIDATQSTRMAWFVPRKKVDYGWWLQQYSSGADSTAILRAPVYRQYDLLRNFLAHYRELERGKPWTVLRLPKGGADTPLLREVRRRLRLLGDLDAAAKLPTGVPDGGIAAAGDSVGVDTGLSMALRQFQHRMGLEPDGKLGPATLQALNTTPKARITQILVNMERNRWLNAAPAGDYLAVNIPEFRLHVYRDDSLLWDMKVVVGKSMHQTAIFSGTLRNIVFSPYWNVPAGILRQEILPGIARDPRYLARHHMERYSEGVRQTPGPWNSLGGVKFLFPNSHSIYLHDTPAKDLFNENSRSFSHGCVRLAEPAKLAAWLLRGDSSWASGRIEEAMHAGKEKWVTAPGNVRVVIVYFTAWVDAQGRLNFRKDIYGRDKRLAALVVP